MPGYGFTLSAHAPSHGGFLGSRSVGAPSTCMQSTVRTRVPTFLNFVYQFNLGFLIGICHNRPAVLFLFSEIEVALD